MKHLEFIEEMRLDNLTFCIPLVLMPLLRFGVWLLKQCCDKKQNFWIAVPGSQSDLMGATKLLRASVSLSTRVLLRINTAELCRILLGHSSRGREQIGGWKRSEITFCQCPNSQSNRQHFGKVPDALGEAGCSAKRDGEAHDTAKRCRRTTALSR